MDASRLMNRMNLTDNGGLNKNDLVENTAFYKAPTPQLKFLKLGTVTIADPSGTEKDLGILPKSCFVTQLICVVDTAFDSGGGDTLVIGIAGAEDVLMAAEDISLGRVGGYAKVVAFATGETDLTVKSKWTGKGDDALTGSAAVYAVYFGA